MRWRKSNLAPRKGRKEGGRTGRLVRSPRKGRATREW